MNYNKQHGYIVEYSSMDKLLVKLNNLPSPSSKIAKRKYKVIIEELEFTDYDLEYTNSNGYGIAYYAIKKNYDKLIKYLLDRKIDFSDMFIYAIMQDINMNFIKEIINMNPNVVVTPDYRGNYPIVYAMINRNCEMISILIKHGSPIVETHDFIDPILNEMADKISLMGVAVSYFCEQSCFPEDRLYNLLLKKNYKITNSIVGNSTILHKALEIDDYDLIKSLIKAGADVNAKNKDGESVLIYYMSRNYISMFIEAIVDKCDDVRVAMIYALKNTIQALTNDPYKYSDEDRVRSLEDYRLILMKKLNKDTNKKIKDIYDRAYKSRVDLEFEDGRKKHVTVLNDILQLFTE